MSQQDDCNCACSVYSTGYCACDEFRHPLPITTSVSDLVVLMRQGLSLDRLEFARWMVQTGRLSDQIAPETHVAPHQAPRSLSVGVVCLTAALVALWLVMAWEIGS